MKLTIKLVVIGLAILLLLFGSAGESLLVKIPPGQVGVRTQRIALLGSQGVLPQDYGPGWNRNLWFIDEWNLFDATIQTFHMSATTGHPFQLKSHDGYSVLLDVTIKYRITKGQAHSVLVNLGPGKRYQGFVENLSRDACRSAFGTMKTEEFYQPRSRNAATQRAREILLRSLQQNKADVDIVEILIRDVKFDEQYERKIKDKKLADQDIELNRSKALAAQQKGLTQKILAETDAMVKVIQQSRDSMILTTRAQLDQTIARITADANRFITEKRADADLHAAQRDAEGTLLTKKAEAAGEEARNQALNGAGGSVIAALEAVRNLNLGDVALSTLRFDPLDLDGVMRKLGVAGLAAAATPRTTR